MNAILIERFPGLVRHWDVLKAAWAEETERARTRTRIEETAFLPAALEVMETPPSPIGRGLLWFLMGCVAIALLWSFIGRMDVVAVAPGKVLPAARVKLIQPTELGVVRAVHVREGQYVKANQLLVELDPTVSAAEAAQASRALMAASVDAARARAVLEGLQGRSAAFTPPPGTPAEVTRTQHTLIAARLGEYRARLAALTEDRRSAEAERAAAAQEIAKLSETQPLLKRQVEARRELAAKGYGSKLQLLDYEAAYIESGKNIGIAGERAAAARAAIAGTAAQAAQVKEETVRAAAEELAEAENRIAVAREDLAKATNRAKLQKLTAPVSGTVQQLKLYTIGGVVQAAEPLMTIVPDTDGGKAGTADGLIVEVSVLNKDIGFLREGQEVAVKLEAFPFTDHGLIRGTLEAISRDAVEDEKLGLVYTARVALDCATNTSDSSRRAQQARELCRKVSPGMAVSAEIKTDQRRIVDYFLSPIARATSEAGRER